MTYTFPRTKFVDENGLIGQLIHIEEEIHEAWKAAQTPDVDHAAEEIMDIYHACETALRILQEKYNVSIHELRRRVEIKNHDREYYA